MQKGMFVCGGGEVRTKGGKIGLVQTGRRPVFDLDVVPYNVAIG